MMINFTGVTNFTLNELHGNQVGLVIQCKTKEIAEQLFNAISDAAKAGKVEIKFDVEKKV